MRRLSLLALGLALGLALLTPPAAVAARYAVGVEHGVPAERVAERIEARTGRGTSVIGPFAVAVTAPSAAGLAAIPGVSYVERVDNRRRLAFVPNDPLAARQWYLDRVRAFDAWLRPPPLVPVRVAIVDSGIDAEHPDLDGSIADGRSFVASPWWKDTNGHGTFVAGQIAAELNNGTGISGMGIGAELLVAKVVRTDETISPEAEARAIRWAVDRGARVINLSFGGIRDPFNPDRDGYSRLEAAAVEYAVANDVLVVAAVGNSDNTPSEPWAYASYPAALPHVLGVSAVGPDGGVPDFSNRDEVYNDIAAPGEEIFSTLPRAITAKVSCVPQGYSDCGPLQYRRGDGTSFAAAQVTGAAAVLFGLRPLLRPEQARAILEASALDATAARGCRRCTPGRDAYTGAGVLDVAAAVEALVAPMPPADAFEPNDALRRERSAPLWGMRPPRIAATLDYWNDPTDVYAVKLRRGQRLRVVFRGPRGGTSDLLVWSPKMTRVLGRRGPRRELAARRNAGAVTRLTYRATASGWHFIQLRLTTPMSTRYTLRVVKLRPRRPRAARPAAPGESSEPDSQRRRLSALRP